MGKRKFRYCDDIENVENYEQAKADNFKGWDCHHRLETHNSDGERRLVDISRDELKALEMYWHRLAEELIFLPAKEHIMLHQKGKKLSEEAKRKLSGTHKGMKLSEEHKRKISESLNGRKRVPFSEEWKNKMSENHKGTEGKHWKLVDGKRVYY